LGYALSGQGVSASWRGNTPRSIAVTTAAARESTPSFAKWSNIVGANSAAARTGPSRLPHPHVATPADGSPSGQTGGLMLMREGGLEMLMTPLSGKAPTWAEIQQVYRTVRMRRRAIDYPYYRTTATSRERPAALTGL
jgi:hypothetical protein